jgi:hypothetical protein
MAVAEAALHRDLAETKAHASGLSQQVEALKKELGNARKQADLVPGFEADALRAAGDLAEALAEIKRLNAALGSASARADKGDAAVAAAKAVADGLKALSAL